MIESFAITGPGRRTAGMGAADGPGAARLWAIAGTGQARPMPAPETTATHGPGGPRHKPGTVHEPSTAVREHWGIGQRRPAQPAGQVLA